MKYRIKPKTFTVLLAAAFLLILNLAADVAGFRIDVTGSGEFSLKPQTKQLLDAIESPVELFILRPADGTDANISLLLEAYTAYTGRIAVTELDAALHPDTVIQLSGGAAVEPGTIFARCTGHVSSAPPDSLYKYSMDYTTMQRYTSLFCGESVVNGLIAAVAGKDMPVLYILEGHGEAPLSPDVLTRIRQEGMSAVTLNLLQDSRPDTGAAAVLIYAPQQDITPGEAEQLLHMSENGSSLLLISQYNGTHLPNLHRITAPFGFTVNESILDEKNAAFTVQNNSIYLRPLIHPHQVTEAVTEQNKPLVIPGASGLSITAQDAVSHTVLLTVSADAESVTATGERTPAPHCPVAAAAVRGNGSKMVLISGAGILDETVDRLLTAGGNNLFAINCISWLAGRSDSWSVPDSDATLKYTSFTSHQINRYSLVIAVIMPLFCFAAAAIIRKWRKSR